MQTSDIFAGKEFCIMVSSSPTAKTELERKAIELGGSVVQNPGNETFCVVADKVSLKVKNVIAKGCYDVVKVNWLQRCIDQQTLLKWVPQDLIHVSQATAAALAHDYDRFGDSYCEDTTVGKLQETFQKITDDDIEPVSAAQIAEIEMKYFPQDSEAGLFRICRVYMDSNGLGEDSPLTLTSLLLRLHGATVVCSLDDTVTAVVIDPRDTSRMARLREVNRKRRKRFHLVTSEWVSDCIKRGKLLDERLYQPAQECILTSFLD